MPQLLSSNSTTMPFLAPFLLTRVLLARGTRNLLIASGLLAVALVAGWLTSTWWAAPAEKPRVNPGVTTPGIGLESTSLEHLDVSGFQKRGNLLIGETVAPSGARLRLVLDARSRQLVGLRIVEEEAPATPTQAAPVAHPTP